MVYDSLNVWRKLRVLSLIFLTGNIACFSVECIAAQKLQTEFQVWAQNVKLGCAILPCYSIGRLDTGKLLSVKDKYKRDDFHCILGSIIRENENG